jgi:HEAT repeat protein
MSDAPRQDVDRLVAALASKHVGERQAARKALVEVGRPAVPPLLNALGSAQQHLRWEAAKTLTGIAHPDAADKLVDALADKDADVRWVVAEALIALGRDAVKPLLSALITAEASQRIYRGAHHVLHDLAQREPLRPLLLPVLKAFDHPEPELAIPNAAEKALHRVFD